MLKGVMGSLIVRILKFFYKILLKRVLFALFYGIVVKALAIILSLLFCEFFH